MLEEILGWVGNILFVYGVYALGKKNIYGFHINSIANLLYAWQSIILNNSPLFWLSLALIVLNLKGIYEWKKFNIKQQNNDMEMRYVKSVADYYNSCKY